MPLVLGCDLYTGQYGQNGDYFAQSTTTFDLNTIFKPLSPNLVHLGGSSCNECIGIEKEMLRSPCMSKYECRRAEQCLFEESLLHIDVDPEMSMNPSFAGRKRTTSRFSGDVINYVLHQDVLLRIEPAVLMCTQVSEKRDHASKCNKSLLCCPPQ